MDQTKEQMYLAGSFTGFRDKVIQAIDGRFPVVDARTNPQYAMFATNESDLRGARESSATGVCFPRGENGEKKSPGVMTFVEMGHSYSANNTIIVADEVDFGDFVKDIADEYFTSIEKEFIPLLKDMQFVKKEKPIARPEEHKGEVKKIKVYGLGFDVSPEVGSGKVQVAIKDAQTELEEFKERSIDLVVVGFRRNEPHTRRGAFAIGMANYFKVPVIIYTDRKVPYPPLTGGLQRRLFTDLDALNEYIHRIETNHIMEESKIAVDLIEKYDGEM